VITGPSGIGKSTIVKLVALQLQKTNDYHILPIMCPKDIVKFPRQYDRRQSSISLPYYKGTFSEANYTQ
jgi:ABC-type transporter Mla maintaining outer membrane lipid asymmetry ATPase subunit MlaF